MSKLKAALKGNVSSALKGRPEYSYKVENMEFSTREAARIVQRTLRNELTGVAPRILQTKVVTQVIR